MIDIPLEDGRVVRGRSDQRSTAIVTRLSDVAPESAQWLWQGRIPQGTLTFLDGDPGVGKSTIALDVAARLSHGLPMPDGSPCGTASTLVFTAEDGLAQVVRPRIDAMGGDPDRLFTMAVREPDGVDRSVVIPDDLDSIRTVIVEKDIGLMVLDPLLAYLPSYVNSWRDHDVRRTLKPLRDVAEETGAAILSIRHLTKSRRSNALYRGGGSIGFSAAARMVLLAGWDPGEPGAGVLAVVKNNLGEQAPSLSYRIEGAPNGGSRTIWDGESPHTADALIGAFRSPEEGTAIDEAKGYLRDVLREGPQPAATIIGDAKLQGIAEKTLRRAQSALGVRAIREGFAAAGRYVWKLPDTIDGQTNKMANHGVIKSVKRHGRTGYHRRPSIDGQGPVAAYTERRPDESEAEYERRSERLAIQEESAAHPVL